MPTTMANGQLAYLRLIIERTKFLDEVIAQVDAANQFVRSGCNSMAGSYDKESQRFKRYWRTTTDRLRAARYKKFRDMWRMAPQATKDMHYDWLKDVTKYTEYRNYPILPKISFSLTTFLMGRGVEVSTQLPKFDRMLEQEFSFSSRVFKWAQECSVFGFIGLQTVVTDNHVDIVRILPDYLFPMARKDCDDRLEYIAKRTLVTPDQAEEAWKEVLRRAARKEYDTEPAALVFEERHYPGYIEYYYWVVAEDDLILGELPIHWYDRAYDAQVVFTGIDDFAITLVPCWEVGGEYLGDWDYLYDLLRSINSRSTQISRILNKSGDPKLLVGDEHLVRDPRSGYVSMPEYRDFMVIHGDDTTKPEYLQASIELAPHFEDMKMLLGMMAVVSHLAPQIIDPFTNIVENSSAYKMSLTPTLTMLGQRGEQQAAALARFVYNHLRLAYVYGAFDEADFKDGLPEPATNDLERDSTNTDAVEQVSEQEPSSITSSVGTLEKPILVESSDGKNYVVGMAAADYTNFKIRNETFQRMVRMERINVRFRSSVPQDEQALISRVGESVSVHRILVEIDGMSEKEADLEWNKIQEEKGEDASSQNFNDQFGSIVGNLEQAAIKKDESGQPISPQDRVPDNQDVAPAKE